MSPRPVTARSRVRRELGQNFLIDRGVVRRMVDLIPTTIPVIDLGAGSGALTRELVTRARRVTAVEIDMHWAEALRQRFPEVRVAHCDIMSFRFPSTSYAVVGNLPYGQTTAITRRLLAENTWLVAALLVQWDVARKRASGGTLVNACWSPWYEFQLHGRIGARSFRPMPSVDGGLLAIRRRRQPLLPPGEASEYQRFVETVFTGRGRGINGILRSMPHTRHLHHAFAADALPRDLSSTDWVRLYLDSSRSQR